MLKCKPLKPHFEQHRLLYQPSRFKVVPAGRRSGKCLAEDTPVVMSDGSIKFVQHIQSGDEVVSLNEKTLRLEDKKVLHSVSNGEKPVVEIITRTGKLICTKNHPIFTGRGWVEAGDLLEDDFIATPKNTDGMFDKYIEGNIYWEEIKSIKEAGTKQTYDLTVEDNHNFIAGGMITHNTEISKRWLLSRAINPWSDELPFPVNPEIENPRFFFAAPTWAQAKSIYWNDIKRMIPDWAFRYGRYGKGGKQSIRESDMTIELMWSTVCVLGLDKPERIEGTPWDGGILDEYANMKSDVWNLHVRPSLSDRRGWAWFIGVPEGRNHYYEMFEDAKAIAAKARAEGKIPEWDGFHWISADILPPEEIEAAKRDLDDLSYAQEYEANFVSFHGRAYYPFNPVTHAVEPLKYFPERDLIFCFDFNVNPGVAVVCQEQPMPGQFQYVERNGQYYKDPIYGTGIIGEVYIPRNSNTPAVCNKLIEDYNGHKGRIICYGDATGGSKGTSQVVGSDWDIIKDKFKNVWENRVYYKVPKSNPRERVRVNSVNGRLLSKAGIIRLMVDPVKCPNTIRDFEGVVLLEGGSGEIDKGSLALTHITDAAGYYIVSEFPIIGKEAWSREMLI